MDGATWAHSRRKGISAQVTMGLLCVVVAAGSCALIAVEFAAAQVPPGLPLPPPLPKLPDKPQDSPPVLPKMEQPQAPVVPEQRELTPPIKISVKGIAIQGNRVFTAEELRAVTNGPGINNSTFGRGNAGPVTITGTEAVR